MQQNFLLLFFFCYFLKQAECSKSQTPQQNYLVVSLNSILNGTAWLPLNWCAPLWANNLPVPSQKWTEYSSFLLPTSSLQFQRVISWSEHLQGKTQSCPGAGTTCRLNWIPAEVVRLGKPNRLTSSSSDPKSHSRQSDPDSYWSGHYHLAEKTIKCEAL